MVVLANGFCGPNAIPFSIQKMNEMHQPESHQLMKRYLNRIFGFTFSRSMRVGVVLFAVLWMFLNWVQAPATGTAVPVDVDSSFVPIAPLNLPRTNHTATLLGNGKILITGGDSEGFIL